MAEHSHIEWTDATWNPVTGCSVLSAGCANCYAMRLAGARLRDHPSRAGLTVDSKAGPVWTGEVRFNEGWLTQPLRWRRPRAIFVCAHGDLFHEGVPDEWIDRVFAVMALAPWHRFQVLTKRSARMRAYLTDWAWSSRVSAIVNAWPESRLGNGNDFAADFNLCFGQPLRNIWLGVSVEDQRAADARVPDLLATPAAVRWLSCEPLIGPVDLEDVAFAEPDGDYYGVNALTGSGYRLEGDGDSAADPCEYASVDWVVAGGESGRGARPMHPDWARALRDQCADAEVPFFFKQWGEWAPGENCGGPLTRTQDTADWFDRGWSFGAMTPGDAEGLHCDDEPALYRCGKRTAGRLLDGVRHDGMPFVRGEVSRG